MITGLLISDELTIVYVDGHELQQYPHEGFHCKLKVNNSLRPSDAYMRQQTNHHWFIGLDNGWSPGRRQAIILTNAGILSIGTLGTNFSKILIEILTFSFKNMHLKVSSGKWQLFCLGPMC